jgi:hypothetical protein
MNFRTGLDRSQTLIFPERLEDFLNGQALSVKVKGSVPHNRIFSFSSRVAQHGKGSVNEVVIFLSLAGERP